MGHFVFIVLHLFAVLFGLWGLFFTIPLHLIYAVVRPGRRPRDPDAPRPETHRRCPECRELVRSDASRCKHCGVALAPQLAPLTKEQRSRGDAGGFVLGVRDTTAVAEAGGRSTQVPGAGESAP